MIQTVVKRDGRIVGFNQQKSWLPYVKPCCTQTRVKMKLLLRKSLTM